jgi:hypothetical protein
MGKTAVCLWWLAPGCSLVAAGAWQTFGGDEQRNGWAKNETFLNKDTVKSVELNWKLRLENQPKEMNSLAGPGKMLLSLAGISRDINVPEPPVVANGVAYAIVSGENVRQVNSSGALYTSQVRASISGRRRFTHST